MESKLTRNDSRLQDALARNRGRRILSVWMDKFKEITHHTIQVTDYLSITETSRLKKAFFEHVKAQTGCCVREWHAGDFSEVLSLLRRMSEHVGPVEVVLFSDVDAYIGAIRVQSPLILYPSPINHQSLAISH